MLKSLVGRSCSCPGIGSRLGVAVAYLLLIPAPTQGQEILESGGEETDTLSFSGMQMYVSVVSGRWPASTFGDSNDASTLQDALNEYKYKKKGNFFYRQWSDPIWDDTIYRILGFSEDPSSLGLEGTNLDDGGILRVSCTPDGENKIFVVTDGILSGGSDGDIEGVYRFDDQVPEETGGWSVSADRTGVFIPDRQFATFWGNMVNRDTLVVRFRDDAQDEYTYLFSLDGLGEVMRRVVLCGGD